jgi:hypothetical protein
MSEPIAVVVPKELYYHEVAYVRGLETKLAAKNAEIAEAREAVAFQNKVIVSGTLKLNEARAEIAALREALTEIADEQKVYKGHGDYDILPKYDAEGAQSLARAALEISGGVK